MATATVTINLTDEEKAEILDHNFCAFTPSGNKALALTLIKTVEEGFVMPAELDSYCDLVMSICDEADRISGDGGCGDTEPRIEVAVILRRLTGVEW